MPRDGTTPGLDAGTQAEVRVAQAWFWDGYYVRQGVDVQHRFGNDVSTVTDLDILAYALDPALVVHKYIGEVKSGRSATTPKPLDRALWARGLRELVGAEAAEVTTAFRPVHLRPRILPSSGRHHPKLRRPGCTRTPAQHRGGR